MRTHTAIDVKEGRDHWWHRLMADAPVWCKPESMDAEDILYILYTSGTTGKPKGIVHTTGGYMTGTFATTKLVFDLKEDDIYWCTADIGWVTGHSYVVYGPLAAGATCVIYEGAPDTPARDRFWDIVERHGVTILYTAPTAIRTFMKWGTEFPGKHDLSSLRLLGTVGEPINPEAWIWYQKTIGKGRCPIVDTWWQTETGAILITPLPGITRTKPDRRPSLPRDRAEDPTSSATIKVEADTSRSRNRGLDAAHALGRRRPLPEAYFGKWTRASIRTARAATRMATWLMDASTT